MQNEVMQGRKVPTSTRPISGAASQNTQQYTSSANRRPLTSQPSKTGSKPPAALPKINKDMAAVMSNTPPLRQESYAESRAHPAATVVDEPITFDYLLQKVVENAAAMTNKTTQDGTTTEGGDVPIEAPTYRVRIDDEGQSIAVT